MGFEPQKFFIGVIDFFSVLLPGVVLTFFVKAPLWRLLEYKPGADELAIFLIVSYLLGHFIFLIGSPLDDYVYDRVKTATFAEQVANIAGGKELSPFWARLLARAIIKKNVPQPVRQAVKIKEYYLDPLNASASINAFQWAKSQLTLDHPEALASVQRFEADSKFFRSLFVVLCIVFPVNLWTHRHAHAVAFVMLLLAFLALLALAFWRYFDQRLKATNQAYWYVITLESQRKDGYRAQAAFPAEGFTHGGGVVYRRTRVGASKDGVKDKIEYLLVQATDDSKKWVLPKGHVNPGERLQETAVREVREESGVWAGIQGKDPLGESAFMLDDEQIKVQFYLMEFLKQERPIERKRGRVWLALNEVRNRKDLIIEDHRKLLELAEKKLTATNQSPMAQAGTV
jgi:ADP-ribose pyrophosphatase YjhB (NUDIX family)